MLLDGWKTNLGTKTIKKPKGTRMESERKEIKLRDQRNKQDDAISAHHF